MSSHPKALWYLTRGTGAVSLLLLTATVVLGVVNSVRWSRPGWPRFALQRIHRNVSLLVVAFIGVHVATAVLDGFVTIRWVDAILPFRAAYRPVWLGLGAVAFDLVIALVATSLIRTRLGFRSWRAVHWLAYACWPVALLHGIGAGSDSRFPWMLLLEGLSVAMVAAAVWWRLTVGSRQPSLEGSAA
jgi:methionine sulfoxide reductase heme-binding subunit